MSSHQEIPLWKRANAIAKYMYEILPDFPEEEKWDTAAKLRHAAVDLVFHAALAEGVDITPSGAHFDWENVRKFAFGLKAVYLFTVDQGFVEIEPDIVVQLDGVIKYSERKYNDGVAAWDKQRKDDLAPWQEKYRLWKEMQK